jgi:ornithine carbamoyltransferase
VRGKRDFLKLADRTQGELRALLDRAKKLKADRRKGLIERTLAGRTLGLLFEKPSTRTRVSFEAAMIQLGGGSVCLPLAESQISRGETLADTARVLSRYLDAIVFRTFSDARLAEFAGASTVPVVNGLSDGAHPVQLLADVLTIEERLGSAAGKTVAFIGDGASNMARSWIEAACVFDFQLRIAAPEGYRPPPADVEAAGPRLSIGGRPATAARGADVIATDVWLSMGQEAEANRRRADFMGYTVDESVVALAAKHAIVLHCLPAHRGDEISDGAIEGSQSAIFDEAENRLHAQKALLEQLLLP